MATAQTAMGGGPGSTKGQMCGPKGCALLPACGCCLTFQGWQGASLMPPWRKWVHAAGPGSKEKRAATADSMVGLQVRPEEREPGLLEAEQRKTSDHP